MYALLLAGVFADCQVLLVDGIKFVHILVNSRTSCSIRWGAGGGDATGNGQCVYFSLRFCPCSVHVFGSFDGTASGERLSAPPSEGALSSFIDAPLAGRGRAACRHHCPDPGGRGRLPTLTLLEFQPELGAPAGSLAGRGGWPPWPLQGVGGTICSCSRPAAWLASKSTLGALGGLSP